MSHEASFVLLCMLLVLVQITSALWSARKRTPSSEPVLSPRRMPLSRARIYLIWQIELVVVFALFFLTGRWTLASVGLAKEVEPPLAFLIGAIAYCGIVLVYTALVSAAGMTARQARSALRVNASLWPRTPGARVVAGLAIIGLNPVTEELLMRGILVHQFTGVLGSPVVPILAGLVLNALLHSYQGSKQVIWHAIFYGCSVALLFSPLGLAGCVGFHFLGDALPILSLPQQALRCRRARAAQRALRVTRGLESVAAPSLAGGKTIGRSGRAPS